MGKTKRKNQQVECNEDQDLEQSMNSVLGMYEPPNSTEKRPKPPQRRDAIDDAIEDDTISIEKISVGTQTDFTTKQISLDENDFIDFKNEIKELVNDTRRDMNKLKKSLLYEVKKMKDDVVFFLSSRDNSASLSDMKNKINIAEPLTTMDEFKEFDKKILTDKAQSDALRSILKFKTRTKSVSEAIGGCISTIMAPELQLLFSGCGKTNRGVSKENFSSYTTYAEIKEFIMRQFPTEKEGDILSKTSRWLANAKDRQSGRKNR